MEQKKQFVIYADGINKEQAVVTIGGREYAVVPFAQSIALSQQRIDFDDRHGNDGLGMELNEQAKRMMTDLAARLYHTAAFTAVEHESPDSSVRSLSMYLPILLPLDERDKWCIGMDDDEIRSMGSAYAEREKTGRPRSVKIVEWEEDGV